MAYEIYDTNGYVTYGPSIHGLHNLRHVLNRAADARTYPQTNMFFKFGYATSPLAFKVELGQLLNKVKDPDSKTSIQNLIDAANKCKDIVILRH